MSDELQQYYKKNQLEVGIDEAGRGCLFGPVCVASVIWPDEDVDPSIVIKDSKKFSSKKKREKVYNYIIQNCTSYSIQLVDHTEIDRVNILQATLQGMHSCLDEISKKSHFDHILVDGTHFNHYYNQEMDDYIPHNCIPKGDNLYKSIAAASILAKTYRDKYISNMVKEHPELEIYDIQNNMGYGTKKHMNAIHSHGITEWHRKTFSPCSNYVNQTTK